MALTGELNDLSLAELIEFFCNQRKTGRLKVIYSIGAGYFYLKNGAVVHARFGDLRGIDAVFYALTQPNASFKFSPAFEAPEQTINQPWTSVVLEGLRRMDEGVPPRTPAVIKSDEDEDREQSSVAPAVTVSKAAKAQSNSIKNASKDDAKAFGVLLAGSDSESFARRRWNPALVVAAVVVVIAAVGIPWGWYTHKRSVQMSNEANAATLQTPVPMATPTENQVATPTPQPETPTNADNETEVARRQREARARERAKALEQAAAANGDASKPLSPASSSNKKAVVTVSYDENGRVTAASGGDATALRIARQKRFPPGKPGSATVTIPIN